MGRDELSIGPWFILSIQFGMYFVDVKEQISFINVNRG